MALNITTDQTIRIAFTVTNDANGDSFSDALYFAPGTVPNNATLRQLAQDRYQAWKTAPAPKQPTLQEKVSTYLARRDARRMLQADLDAEDPAVVAAAVP